MSEQALCREVEELRRRLEDAEGALRAIRDGEVDSLAGLESTGGQLPAVEGAEDPYRVFLERMNEGAATLTPDGAITYSNRRFSGMLKTPLELVTGSALEEFAAPGDRDRIRRLLEKALLGRAEDEVTLVAADGGKVWARLSLSRAKRNDATAICLIATDLTEHQRADELRSYLAAIVSFSNDAIIGKDLEGKVLSWNAGAERLYGYSAEEIIGRSISILFPPERSGELSEILARAGRGEMVERYEAERIRKSGRRIRVTLTVSPMWNREGRIVGASTIARDFTEHERAETAIRCSEQQLNGFFNSSPAGMLIVDREFRFLRVNERLAFINGRSAEEHIGKSFREVIPNLAAELEAKLQEVFETGEPLVNYELRGETPRDPGEPRHWTLSYFPIRQEDGRITTLGGVVLEITARKRAEEALRESETAFRVLTDAMPQMVWACTPDGLNVYFNQRWVDYTGLTLEESYGRGWNTPFHPDDKQAAWDAWNLATATGETYRVESRLRAADGSYRWFLMRGVPVLDAQGSIRRWFGTCTDIQDLKSAEEALQQLNEELEQRVEARTAELVASNKELEAFSYSVSHDLRAPLRSMDGFCEALIEDCGEKLDAEGRSHLERVRAAGQRMGRLVDGLLDLSRMSRIEMRRTAVDLSGMARTIALEMQKAHPARQVEFVVAPGLVVDADADLLRAVLENLMGNAWKFTSKRERARIEVGMARHEDGTAYFVRDDGSGFDMAYGNKLFGAFQRLHTPAEFEGTGIGLATVQRIIHRHGGRVWAEGQVEQGATFFFTIPGDSRRA